MKVLHIVEQVYRAGIEMLELDLCRNAKDNDLELVFVTFGKGDLFEEFKNSGVEFYHFQRKAPIDFSIIFKLRKLIKKEKIRVVHVHHDVTLVHVIIATIFLSTKVVQSIHGFTDKRSPLGKSQIVSNIILKTASYFLPITFTVSEYLKQELIKSGYYKKRLRILYNGIDFSKIKTNNFKKQENDFISFGMVGNFNHVRNHSVLLEAFAKLVKINSNIELKLAGKQGLLEKMKNYALSLGIADKVKFCGSISDVSNFLSNIDIYVYSSRSDTFGISVIEAMYFGIPVIVSDNGPFIEITENGKYAYLFKANDPDSLFNLMITVLDNYLHNNKNYNNIREGILNKFSIQVHIAKLKYYYNKLTE